VFTIAVAVLILTGVLIRRAGSHVWRTHRHEDDRDEREP
jgi:hypothetical protein